MDEASMSSILVRGFDGIMRGVDCVEVVFGTLGSWGVHVVASGYLEKKGSHKLTSVKVIETVTVFY